MWNNEISDSFPSDVHKQGNGLGFSAAPFWDSMVNHNLFTCLLQ